MHRLIVILLTSLLATAVARAEDLAIPVAMASEGEQVFMAYSDHTVWWAHGEIREVPAANRGIAISAMCPEYKVLIAYADNQVWRVEEPNTATFLLDMTRPDRPEARIVEMSTGSGVVAAYDDGQIWAHDGHLLRRVEMWERPKPTANVNTVVDDASPIVVPNPATGECRLSFRLEDSGATRISILDASGRIVRQLLDESLPAGEHRIAWDGRDNGGVRLPAGVYFSRMRAGAVTVAGRIVVAK